MPLLNRFLLLFVIIYLSNGCTNPNQTSSQHPPDTVLNKPNILFIAVDDLRPELGIYGNKIIQSPNIDALGEDGIVFKRAHVQQAVCNPSRASIMTGLRPDATKVHDLWTDFRDSIPDVVTLPQHFKSHGYHSVGIGKIYHNIFPDSLSWSEPKLYLKQFPFDPDAYYVNDENLNIQQEKINKIIDQGLGEKRKDQFGHYYLKANATEITDLPDNAYYDGAQTDVAVKKLVELSAMDKPFFFAVGFYRPHLPYNAPRKYWDLYHRDSIPLADNRYPPKNSPVFSVNTLKEIRGYTDYQDTPSPHDATMEESKARLLKHGYYASVSYIDAQIGRLIQQLKSLGQYDNTIIVLWGDHGYKLGEHNAWTKFTNYHIDTHAPLIIKQTSTNQNKQEINQLVEFVDLYPTLCDMANLEKPKTLEGLSLLPLMKDNKKIGKSAIFSQFLKESYWAVPEANEQMGRSILTDEFHYIEWRDWKRGTLTARELYDLKKDPNEHVNVADDGAFKSTVSALAQLLHDGWRTEKAQVTEAWASSG